jgi:hypothetical protein
MIDLPTTLEAIQLWPVADQLELIHRVWDQLVESGGSPG